jgi:putative pyruvate formate lyase activating enzyme
MGGLGTAYDVEGLLALAEGLLAQGVHNLNCVTPDHVWPTLERMLTLLRARGHTLPLVLNSSGYHLPEQVDRYATLVDIFLPDFKFADSELARTVMGDAAYPDLALASLRRMVEHRGFLEPWDTTGQRTAERGVLVRHLVLPGAVENSLSVLRCLRKEFGRYLPLSIMSQYHPMPACEGRGDFARPLRVAEYARITEEVEALGFENVFVQDAYSEEAFLPDFTKDHPFQGNPRPLPKAAARESFRTDDEARAP